MFTVKPFCNLSLPLSAQPHLGVLYVPGRTHTQWRYSIMVCIILLCFSVHNVPVASLLQLNYEYMVRVSDSVRATVRFRVYLLRLVRFYQA